MEGKFYNVPVRVLKKETVKLRECPLCGSFPVMHTKFNQYNEEESYDISCSNVACMLKLATVLQSENREELIRKWNTRYADQEEQPEPAKDP